MLRNLGLPVAEKSGDAYRTISEVATDLDLPQHVLRFWESRFPQIRPLKRGGGRRFYRPTDVVLLRDIRRLLHAEGYTIKGVQRLLRERGGADKLIAVHHDESVEHLPDASDGTDHESLVVEVPEAAATGVNESQPAVATDLAALREALALVDECQRHLTAALLHSSAPAAPDAVFSGGTLPGP